MNGLVNSTMTEKEFNRFRDFIEKTCGIKMPQNKRTMLEGRLKKRLKELGFSDFKAYANFVFDSPEGKEEIINMIDVVTTNKTDFFREPDHFDYLKREVIPFLINYKGSGEPIRIWSAGCSTGEEPYTLGIVMSEYSREVRPVNFEIYASDISTQVLEKAKKAIYKDLSIEGIPLSIKTRYFLKSKDPSKGLVRIIPELRSKVHFFRLNFMDDDYMLTEPMDIIFCRNVIIYFDKDTQEAIINKLCQYLVKGGYLFLGHSESIHGMNVPVKNVAPTIHKRV